MKSRHILPLLLLLPLLTVVSSCTGNKSSNPSAADDCHAAMVWDSVAFATRCYYPQGDSSAYCSIGINLEFPTGDSVATQIRRGIISEALGFDDADVKASISAYAESVKQSYLQDMESLYCPELESAFANQYEYTVEGKHQTDNREGVVSYVCSRYSYTGGVHGDYGITCSNFDAQTGQAITDSDVFNPQRRSDLLAAIRHQLMIDSDCTTLEQLKEETGILLLGDVYVSESNFLLREDSVEFVFNPYEIAPYSSGIIRVVIANELLAPFFLMVQ